MLDLVRGKSANTWHSTVLPNGKLAQVRATLKNGIEYVSVKLPVVLTVPGSSSRYDDADTMTINTRTGVVTEKLGGG
jgi:electron transfer flavoprotein alpha/beta subunit